jgi:hypothetical protein
LPTENSQSLINITSAETEVKNLNPMTTHHLPISIPDILHGKSVEWERLEFKGKEALR